MSAVKAVLISIGLLTGISHIVKADYPLIQYTIVSRDPLYGQQQQDVESWYAGRSDAPSLAIYRYLPRASENLFSVAAAFNLPYESVATLNGWDSPSLFFSGQELLIPNTPGLFAPEKPRNKWEEKLLNSRAEIPFLRVVIKDALGNMTAYRFHPGEKFSSSERIRFLGSLFSSPLEGGQITSPFGYRPHPFSGKTSFHTGIDLKASIGTPIMAVRSGIVAETGVLEIYGLFVILNHDGGYQTVYAHLDKILVTSGQAVVAGERIALSGNSGLSTGPHLHFEIRKNGLPVNPSKLTAIRE